MVKALVCVPVTRISTHFDDVLNLTHVINYDENNKTTDITAPLLDEAIMPVEVPQQIRKMKPNKVSGPDGLPPGVPSLLPVQWILNITTLFSSIE